MKVYYEENWMDGQLFKGDQLIDSKEKLEEISFKQGDNLFVEFASHYYFYETPWERDDATEIILDLNGDKFEAEGMFRNKTRQFVIRALSSAG